MATNPKEDFTAENAESAEEFKITQRQAGTMISLPAF
jgi:hypothetical protein